jgi:hypothetical protein
MVLRGGWDGGIVEQGATSKKKAQGLSALGLRQTVPAERAGGQSGPRPKPHSLADGIRQVFENSAVLVQDPNDLGHLRPQLNELMVEVGVTFGVFRHL